MIAALVAVLLLVTVRPDAAPAQEGRCPTRAEWQEAWQASVDGLAEIATGLMRCRGGIGVHTASVFQPANGASVNQQQANEHQTGLFCTNPHRQPVQVGGRSKESWLAEQAHLRQRGWCDPPPPQEPEDPPEPPEEEGEDETHEEEQEFSSGVARATMTMGGSGAIGSSEAWNCSGLEGEWQVRSSFAVPGLGEIAGSTTFTMPPRPEDGPWRSEPTTLTMTGTMDAGMAQATASWTFGDLVYTISTGPAGYLLSSEAGSLPDSIHLTTPDISMDVPSPIGDASMGGEPVPIEFAPHRACD